MERKTFYRGDLPHYLPNDRPYFLTFRLAGSEHKDNQLLSKLLFQKKFIEYDKALDRMQSGPHHLRLPHIAQIIKEALLLRDGIEYDLIAFTLMSNHVHMIISIDHTKNLPDILRKLKSWTARECNRVLGLNGDFWMHEGYDRVIRDGKLGNAVIYTINNPVTAGIVERWQDYPHTYLCADMIGPGFERFTG